MKSINFLLLLASGLLLTFNSCNSDDLSISQDEEIMNLQLDKSKKETPLTKEIFSSVNGQGTFNWDGVKRHFTFHANTMPDGSIKGSGVLTITNNTLKIMFDIDCMIIDGNTATMTGYITKFDGNHDAVGNHCWFMVIDNGEGANAINDQISSFYAWSPELYGEDCNQYDESVYNIDGGNIQVK